MPEKYYLIGSLKDRKIFLDNIAEREKFYSELNDKKIVLIGSEYEDSKTNRQLGYWHTAFVESVQEAEKKLGRVLSHKAVHQMLKRECPLLIQPAIEESSGEILFEFVESFSEISKKKLSEVMEFIFQYAAERYGIVIPGAVKK